MSVVESADSDGGQSRGRKRGIRRNARKPNGEKIVVRVARCVIGQVVRKYLDRAVNDYDRRLRMRRVLALLGRVICGLELAELGVALGLTESAMSKDIAAVSFELRADAETLGYQRSDLLGPELEAAS